MSDLKVLLGLIFGNRLTIAGQTLTTRQIKRNEQLHYLLTHDEENHVVQIEVVLPTNTANVAADYIKRSCALDGASVFFEEGSDEYATKMNIRMRTHRNVWFAIAKIEAILLRDLDYQYEDVSNVINHRCLADYGHQFDLDVNVFNTPTEEERRIQGESNLIEYRFYHYTHNGKGINVIQNTTHVTKGFLEEYLRMMERMDIQLSGRVKLAKAYDNIFELYIFE